MKKKTLYSIYDSAQIPTCINVMNVSKLFVLCCQYILWLLWIVFIYFSPLESAAAYDRMQWVWVTLQFKI